MLLFWLSGVLLLRFAERVLVALLLKLPPRFTRFAAPLPGAREYETPEQLLAQTPSLAVHQVGHPGLHPAREIFQ